MMKLGPLLFIFLCAQVGWSQSTGIGTTSTTPSNPTGPVISDVDNVSAQSLVGTPKIWGGLGGSYCTVGDAPCNSCQEMVDTWTANKPAATFCNPLNTGVTDPKAPFCACNENRIYNNLMVTIYLKDSDVAPIIIKSNQSTDLTPQNDGPNGKNFVQLRWSRICQLISDNNVADCNFLAPKSGTLQIWVDKNSDGKVDSSETTNLTVEVVPSPEDQMNAVADPFGAAEYTAYPGDEKIYIENMSLPAGTSIKKITIWFSDLGFDQTYYSQANYQTFDVDADGNISVPRVTGLTNGKTYHFRTSVSDQAGNIGGWATDAYITSVSSGNCATTGIVGNPSPIGTDNCAQAGKPDQVLGLLSEDMNCFIATAAYGSSLEPKLNTFRKFRQLVLLPRPWGRNFVFWYYDAGPRAARWMQDKPEVRATVRTALWPAYGFALLAVRWGLPLAVSIYILLPLGLLSLLVIVFRKRMARAKN